MKLISPEEKDKMLLIPTSRKRGKAHPVRLRLENLEPSQILHIPREDFKWKNRTPLYFISQIEKESDKKFELLEQADEKGWVVERVK